MEFKQALKWKATRNNNSKIYNLKLALGNFTLPLARILRDDKAPHDQIRADVYRSSVYFDTHSLTRYFKQHEFKDAKKWCEDTLKEFLGDSLIFDR